MKAVDLSLVDQPPYYELNKYAVAEGHMKLAETRISARDRRFAAIHEAGHVVVGRHFELSACAARIFRTDNPHKHAKLWGGTADLFTGTPSEASRSLREVLGVDNPVTVAVAGAVAEFCWQRVSFDETVDLGSWEEPEVMSISDWQLAECEPGSPSKPFMTRVRLAFKLLNHGNGILWHPLLSEARKLIVASR